MSNTVPERMCISCRQMMAKAELFRFAKSPEGEVSFDRSGKAQGRGAYLCKNPSCYNKALKSKALSRTFKTQVPDDILQSLEEKFSD